MILSDKFRAKMWDEEKASGINTDLGDVEKALEEILEKEAVVEEIMQNDKKNVDNAKAAEIRYIQSSREPWQDTEKTKERWGREWNSSKSKMLKKW